MWSKITVAFFEIRSACAIDFMGYLFSVFVMLTQPNEDHVRLNGRLGGLTT
jgi:hypothetical protein